MFSSDLPFVYVNSESQAINTCDVNSIMFSSIRSVSGTTDTESILIPYCSGNVKNRIIESLRANGVSFVTGDAMCISGQDVTSIFPAHHTHESGNSVIDPINLMMIVLNYLRSSSFSPSSRTVTFLERQKGEQEYEYQIIIGDITYSLCTIGKKVFRNAIFQAFNMMKCTNLIWNSCSDYSQFLADSHNKTMHCLNGNIVFVYNIPIVNRKVKFNFDEYMLQDDQKLVDYARQLSLTPQKFFELCIVICCHDYLYVPYISKLHGKQKAILALSLYRGKKARFAWKDVNPSQRTGLWLVNFFVVSRFQRFLRCREESDFWNELDFSAQSQMMGLGDLAKVVASGQAMQALKESGQQLGKVEELLPKIQSTLNGTESLLDKVFGKLDVLFNNPLFSAFCKVGESLSTVVDSISNFITGITDSVASSLGIDPNSKMITFVCALIFIVILLLVIVAAGSLTSFICELVKLSTTMLFNRTCSLKPQCESQAEIFPLYFEVESQMETSVLLGTLFSMGVYLATGTKIDKPNFAREITSWGTILGTFCEKSPMFLDKCFQAATGSPLFSETTDFTDFLDDMYCVVYTDNIDDLVCTDPSSAEKVKNLFEQLQVYKKYIMNPRIVQGTNQAQVALLVKKLEDLYLKSKTSGDDVHNHPEPVAMYLYGDTKQGKSHLSRIFPGAFYSELRKLPEFKGTPKFAKPWSHANVYPYNQSAEFQDRYFNQFCLSINEFAQFKEETKRAIVAEKLVNLIDISACPFTSSDVREKGLHNMTSDLVIINSNVDEFHRMGLSRPDALVRRLHYRLKVVRTGTFDKKKRNFDEAWKFVLKHSLPSHKLITEGELAALEDTGLEMGKEYVFSEILASMVALYRKRHSSEDDPFDIDWDGPESQMMLNSPFQPLKVPSRKLFKSYYHGGSTIKDVIHDVPCREVATGLLEEIATKVVNDKFEGVTRLIPCGVCLRKVDPDFSLTDDNNKELLAAYIALMMYDPYWSAYITMCCVNEDLSGVRRQILICATFLDQILRQERYPLVDKEYQCCCMHCNADGPPKQFVGKIAFGRWEFANLRGSNIVKTCRELNVKMPADHWQEFQDFDLDKFCERQRVLIEYNDKTMVEHFICIVQDAKIWFIKVVKQVKTEVHYFNMVASAIKTCVIMRIRSAFDSIRTIVRRVWDYVGELVLSCVTWIKSIDRPTKAIQYVQETGANVIERVGNAFDDVVDTVSSFSAKDWVWVFGIVLFVTSASLGIGASISYLVDYVESKDQNIHRFKKENGELDSQGFYDKYKQQVTHSRLIPYGSKMIAESQMSNDDKCKYYLKILAQNSRYLELIDSSGYMVGTNCLFINTKHAVFVKHVTKALNTEFIRVYDPIGNTYQEFRHPQFKFRFPSDQRDCCFIDFEVDIEGTFLSVINHLKSQPKRFTHNASRIMKMFDPSTKKLVEAYSLGKEIRYESTDVVVAKCFGKDGKVIETPQLGYYIVAGGGGFKGACGFPWFSEDAVDQNTSLLGIHVAQWGDSSICCPIFVSDFTDFAVTSQYHESHRLLIEKDPLFLKEAFSFEIPYPEEFQMEVSSVMPGTYPYLKPKRVEGSAMSSKLVPSAIFDFLPSHTDLVRPARMKPFRNDEGELISPIKLFYKKYQQYCDARPCTFLYKLFDRSPEDLWDGFEPKLREPDGSCYKHRWATIEEVLFGSQEKGYESMDGTGSAGFKLRSMPGKGKRSDWFNKTDRYIDPYLRYLVEERISKLKQGKRIPQIVIDCLKDELREHERVRIGKTRVFCVGEFVACIVAKMFFIDYLTRVKALRAGFAASVGTNVHNADWTYLGRTAFKFGRSRVFGGDLPTMDVSTQRIMAQFAIKYLKTRIVFEPEDALVLEGLMFNVVTTLHVSGAWTYFFESGNSSGNYLTSWFNCFCCYTYMSASFYYLRPEDETATFVTYIGIVVYGDDNLGSVHKDCYWFDNLSLTRALKELFNLDFTDPNKGEIKESWLPESDQIFLSRKFIDDDGDGTFRAPLEDSSLYGMLHYVRENDVFTLEQQLMTNVEVFAQEMSHFSVQEGKDRWQIVQEALKQAGLIYTKGSPQYWKQSRLQNWSMSYF